MKTTDAAKLETVFNSEYITCPECGGKGITYPAEGVPDQSLRGCPFCEEVFFVDPDTMEPITRL